MKAALLYGARDIRVEELPEPKIRQPGDAIVRVLLSCVCGSDLWDYRDSEPLDIPVRMGHEFLGVVEEVGTEVSLLRPGNVVVAPFLWNDGSCFYCQHGLPTSCLRGGWWGAPDVDGGQGEFVRVPYADATLVPAPVAPDDGVLPALLPLSDVLGTGHHAAVMSGVRAGSTVMVIGDGAVGLCAVLAARRLQAGRIIMLGSNPARTKLAQSFGATDIVTERGQQAIEQVLELTGGIGADHALECVGTDLSWAAALGGLRDGGSLGFVGVPGGVTDAISVRQTFRRNLSIAGGVAPVRAYLPELMPEVLDGRLDASAVFDRVVDFAHIPDGYAAMDDRSAIKVLIRA